MNHNMQMQKETGKILHRKFLSENIGLLLMDSCFPAPNVYSIPIYISFRQNMPFI